MTITKAERDAIRAALAGGTPPARRDTRRLLDALDAMEREKAIASGRAEMAESARDFKHNAFLDMHNRAGEWQQEAATQQMRAEQAESLLATAAAAREKAEAQAAVMREALMESGHTRGGIHAQGGGFTSAGNCRSCAALADTTGQALLDEVGALRGLVNLMVAVVTDPDETATHEDCGLTNGELRAWQDKARAALVPR